MKTSLAGDTGQHSSKPGSSDRPKKADPLASQGPSHAKSTGNLDYSIASTSIRSDWYVGVYTHWYLYPRSQVPGLRSQVSGKTKHSSLQRSRLFLRPAT